MSDQISFSREWVRRTIECLQGDLPPGKIGDNVFLLRQMLKDKLDEADREAPPRS